MPVVNVSLPTDTCTCSCATSLDKGTFDNPASSCHEVVRNTPNFQPGYIWIARRKQGPLLVYCVATTHYRPGGWMRVANLDMTNTKHKCPSGFDIVITPTKRLCQRKVVPGCTSIMYNTHGISYTDVYGRVIGYQRHTTDAFW